MNSNKIFTLIENIALEPGKNAKIQMLKDSKCDLLEKVLKYAYDPTINFGINKIDYPTTNEERELCGFLSTSSDVWELLNKLANRELTGNAARSMITSMLHRLNKDSAELLTRIIRKDLRAGFSESTINKVYTGLIPEFPYMRCSLIKDAKDLFKNGSEISQVKADGMFCNINVYHNGNVEMLSRQGKPLPVEQYADIAQCFKKNRVELDYQYHGELLVKIDGKIVPREIGNGILNSVNSGKGKFESNQEPVFIVWDMIPIDYIKSKGKYNKPYIDRFNILLTFYGDALGSIKKPVNVIETKFVANMEEAMNHYRECIARGLEGTILKTKTAIWKDGTSKEMFKLKVECDMSLRVIEIEEGREHTKNEGRPAALLCESECGKLRVSVVIKNEDMQNRVEDNPDEWIDKIVEVRANSIMKPTGKNEFYSLFLPRLVESDYRTDKFEADSLSKIQDQFESLIKG